MLYRLLQVPRQQIPRKRKHTHLITQVLKPKRIPVPKPILERDPRLAQILLLEHILVPHHKLDDAQLIREREVDGEIKRRVLRAIRRVQSALRDRSLVLVPEEGHNHEAAGRMGCVSPYQHSSAAGIGAGTHGSLEPFRSLASNFVQLSTCTLNRTTGSSPGRGTKPPLPRPPDTRAGSRFSARPIFKAFFFGAGAISVFNILLSLRGGGAWGWRAVEFARGRSERWLDCPRLGAGLRVR